MSQRTTTTGHEEVCQLLVKTRQDKIHLVYLECRMDKRIQRLLTNNYMKKHYPHHNETNRTTTVRRHATYAIDLDPIEITCSIEL